MNITDLMLPELIIFDDSIRSKEALFHLIGESFHSAGRATNSKKLIKDLFKRENETSTGIEAGFGIPHAKSKHVTEPSILFAHVSQLNDYQGLDGQPIECVFSIIVPKKASDVHLEILSSLSRKLMDEDFRKQLKNATTREEILAIMHT